MIQTPPGPFPVSKKSLQKSKPVLTSNSPKKFLILILLWGIFSSPAQAYTPEPEEAIFLSKIEKDSLQYFVRMSDKTTGLTRDSSQQGSPASIAATGFALASIAVGQSRGWIAKEQAYNQILKTLKTLLTKAEHKNGFFYHFLDVRSGKRIWGSEASSIDTALLTAGALVAAQYYPGSDIEKIAHQLYERIDWAWMMNHSDFVCMGWKPESGFLPYYWDSYNELMILEALAIGSATHPIPKEAWFRWMRHEEEYKGKKIIHSSSGSLFTYQYAQAFIDFRELDDAGVNYFDNSTQATIANWEYSLEFGSQFRSYSQNSWGLSASLGPGGYKAYGAKPGEGLHDGTIAPYAALASIIFTPKESIQAAKFFYENYQENLYGIFGFKDSFNLDKNWWAQEYLGLDQGIVVLMLENFLNDGIIWKKFMGLEAVKKWVDCCGLKKKEEPFTLSS
jgi:hypothetical protein